MLFDAEYRPTAESVSRAASSEASSAAKYPSGIARFRYNASVALASGGPGAAALADARPPGDQRPRLPDSQVPELSGNLGETPTYSFNGTVPTSRVSDRETAPPPAASCSTA